MLLSGCQEALYAAEEQPLPQGLDKFKTWNIRETAERFRNGQSKLVGGIAVRRCEDGYETGTLLPWDIFSDSSNRAINIIIESKWNASGDLREMAAGFPYGERDVDRDKRNQTVRRVLGAAIAEALPDTQTMQNTLGLAEKRNSAVA